MSSAIHTQEHASELVSDTAKSAQALVKSGLATVQKGVAKSDGKLTLNTSELHFTPFNQQLGMGPYVIQLDTITAITKCWGRGGGIIPITSNGIELSIRGGGQFQFIVANPEEWIALLQRDQ